MVLQTVTEHSGSTLYVNFRLVTVHSASSGSGFYKFRGVVLLIPTRARRKVTDALFRMGLRGHVGIDGVLGPGMLGLTGYVGIEGVR